MGGFMKIKVGIVGYGNLGKAIEKRIKNIEEFELVAIFSKRDLPNAVKYEKIENYKNKIDVLFLCGGSQNELEKQGIKLIKNFNIVESYDNHAKLKKYVSKIDSLAKKYKKVSLCSFGWDPGLFSFMRGLFDSLGYPPYTFWGKGLSQGHTQAIKNIRGVKDALQFTLPNEHIKNKIKKGVKLKQDKSFHKRLCYVVCDQAGRENIKKKIMSMPDYFEGYKTQVHFASQEKLNKLKSFSHRGEVVAKGNIINFSLNLPSNPDFTASVAVCYARAISKLIKDKRFGAYTIFDLPLKTILKKNKFEYL